MLHGCMVLSYVVTIVGWPRSRVMAKRLLHFSALQPVETHVHGFDILLRDVVVDNLEGRGVVGLNWCRWC